METWVTNSDPYGQMLEGKKILITGGTGTLGKAVLTRARRNSWGAEFVIFSRDETKQSILRQMFPEHQYVLGDITRYNDLKRAMRGVDIVMHFAAYKQVPSAQNNIAATIETNIYGSQQVVEAAIDMGVSQVVTTSTDKACLDWHARVLLADGTSKPIGELVKERYDGEVVTIDPNTGEQKLGRVVGWYKNKLGGRKRYRLTYRRAYLHVGKLSGTIVTEDHLILTTKGWVPAGSLTDDYFIITNEPEPNFKQYGLLVGTLLGDSSLTQGRRSRLVVGHSERQRQWLETKIAALRGFIFSEIKTRSKKGKNNFCTSSSKAYATLGNLREAFYSDKAKIVPKQLLEKYFSPYLMAAWFMDDGCISHNNGGKSRPSARLATHGFTEEEVIWLCEFLTNRGFECNYLLVKVDGKYYPELRFTVEGTQSLFNFIRPGILSEMSNKIDYVDYDPTFWDLGTAERYIDTPILKEYKAPSRDVYCIDVEDTHTFVSGSVVVHNCSPENAYGVGKKMVEYVFQDANKYGATKFHITRYGNVLASNQSVAVLWEHQAKAGGPITITDRRMTRFFLSIDEAINQVLMSLQSEPGVILVPKAPSILMIDFAKEFAQDLAIVDIGLRPGEKIHEGMVSEAESFYTEDKGNFYLIHPPTSSFRNESAPFSYTSDKPSRFLSAKELLEMLDTTHALYGV